MIDLRLLRGAPGDVRAALARRGDSTHLTLLDELETLDTRRRTLVGELDGLKAERNTAAKADAALAKQGGIPPRRLFCCVHSSFRAVATARIASTAEVVGLQFRPPGPTT